MKKCSNEKFNKEAIIQNEIRQRVLNYIPTMLEIASKYDGKLVNKRLLTALEKSCPKCPTPYGGERSELIFEYDFGSMTITFLGIIEGENDRYYNRYQNSFSLFNCDLMVNTKFNFAKFKESLIDLREKLIANIEYTNKLVENYDRVAKVYKQAYDLLMTIAEFRGCADYADIQQDPEMFYLRNVLLYKHKK